MCIWWYLHFSLFTSRPLPFPGCLTTTTVCFCCLLLFVGTVNGTEFSGRRSHRSQHFVRRVEHLIPRRPTRFYKIKLIGGHVSLSVSLGLLFPSTVNAAVVRPFNVIRSGSQKDRGFPPVIPVECRPQSASRSAACFVDRAIGSRVFNCLNRDFYLSTQRFRWKLRSTDN